MKGRREEGEEDSSSAPSGIGTQCLQYHSSNVLPLELTFKMGCKRWWLIGTKKLFWQAFIFSHCNFIFLAEKRILGNKGKNYLKETT